MRNMAMLKKAMLIMMLITLMGCAVWAQTGEVTTAGAPPPVKKTTLWDLIKTGGWAMWPLGLCSVGLIAVVVLNFRQINQRKLIPSSVIPTLQVAAAEGDIGKMLEVCAATPSLFTNALQAGLRKLNPEDPVGSKSVVESAIAEAVGREESLLGFWINFLSLITAISPMLGLLGTVSGMIGAFQKIAGGGMGKPELLAGNIGEALITTATGLIIAIPSLFFYFLFRNMLNRIIQRAEEQYSLLLDTLTGEGAASAQS